MKKINLILAFLLISVVGKSQELNCFVSVNASQVEGTDRDKFNTLQESLADFLNNTVWSNNVFDVQERIECNMQLNISREVTTGDYEASLNIQARRPVYGSSYNTVMFNYVDKKVNFEYTEFDPLEFSETSHIHNLTSVLAFYVYIILGIDYDSFSSNGGTPFFEKAERIVNNAQSSSEVGWKGFEDRTRKNRYWLVNNMLDNSYAPLREFYYVYHRLGLDGLDKSIEQGRIVIRDALIDLEKFFNSKPDPFMHYYYVTLESKSNEIIQIFSEANQADQTKIQEIMSSIDPGNASKYSAIKK